METRKSSIPRQLMLLVGVASAAVVAAAALYYFTSSRTFNDSAAVMTATVARLDNSYNLLERVSGDMNNLQQLLRLEDPDSIEKAVQNLEASQKQSTALIAACGAAGAGVKAEFDVLTATEKGVVDEFVKGQNALADEKFLREASPQASAVLDEIRKYHQDVQTAAQQALAAQQGVMKARLLWQSATLGLVLVVLLYAGWRLKRRIVGELLAIASELGNISRSSASSSRQVSTASQTLAEGASKQAASLEETSSSLEELASITQHNAENAQQASSLARQAREAADKGVADMHAMSAAMQAIKGSSDDIAKIIKTIDEIAFQTNILALNAAVEAARAGEAGMGFAVVADEVRNLAQRSAQAAKETSAKIEGAISNTAQGVTISGQVAQSLNEIVARARQVDELASAVAGASREQTQGISQINVAVSQMDKVTQNNAASAEESAAAAEELNAQAEVIKQLVGNLIQLVGGESSGDHAAATPQKAPSPASNGRHVANGAAAPAKKLSPATPLDRRTKIPLADNFKNF